VRSFWFAGKLAILFALLVGILITAIIHLFGRVAGHGLLRELGVLRAHEGVMIAEHIEPLLDQHPLDSPEVRELVARAAQPWGIEVRMQAGAPSAAEVREARLAAHGIHELSIRGRRCRMLGHPPLVTQVPILHQGRVVGHLALGGPLHPPETHSEFMVGVLEIGVLTIAGVIGLSLYLAAPLRRMSRSMDRIAAGDLAHRVQVRGRDEVAAMGRSFNAMADRIGAMITGQKELMAGVSHELRSPLTRMKVALELLRNEPTTDGINDLECEVDTLDAMVEELLVASRLDLGSALLKPEPLDLAELAEEAWDRVAPAATAAGMELEYRLDDHARLILADQGLIVRLLGNLFENAVRYAGRGTVSLVSERCTERLDRVEMTVSDQGPGVDGELLQHLFEPFFRADPSRSRKTGATGLGLMIVRRAVAAHGGSVRAHPAPGGGLAVTFDLPAAGEPEPAQSSS
jgi:signal transduction histidine kinase